MAVPMSYSFGRFQLRASERRLLCDGNDVPIGARAFDVLLALVEGRDRLVTKRELLDRVWPGIVVEEGNIQTQVSGLRKALGADVIATVPGLGYRFAKPLDGELHCVDPGEGSRASGVGDPTGALQLLGRDTELSETSRLLERARCLTIWGPGGVGKTTLARALLARRASRFGAATHWIDTAPLASGSDLMSAIADSFRIRTGGMDATQSMLTEGLAGVSATVTLDGCEHLVAEAAPLVQALVTSALSLTFVVTTREPLRIPQEYRFHLTGLAFPEAPVGVDAARTFAAMQLLEACTERIGLRGVLTDDVIEPAIQLCRALAGNPLALEMAAARLPVLGIAELVQRLDRRFELLRSDRRHPEPHQRTLRDTLDWSFSLLSEPEKRLLRRLSVFSASFGLAAYEQMAAGLDFGDVQTAYDLLGSLVDKSLVEVQQVDPPRYRLLDTTRLYAAEQLAACGEAVAAQADFVTTCASVALESEQRYWTVPEAQWRGLYGGDCHDLQRAFDMACASGDAACASAIGVGVALHASIRDAESSLLPRMRALHMLLGGADALASARILTFLTSFPLVLLPGLHRGDLLKQRIEQWRALGNVPELARAIAYCAIWLIDSQIEEAERARSECLSLVDTEWSVQLRHVFALFDWRFAERQGDVSAIREKARYAIELARAAGDRVALAMYRRDLAALDMRCGALEAARAALASCVPEFEALEQPSHATRTTMLLCTAALLQDDLPDAFTWADRCLASARQAHMRAAPLTHLAFLAARCGLSGEAARLLGASDAWYRSFGGRRGPLDAEVERRVVSELADSCGPQDSESWRAAGAAMTPADAFALACDVVSRARQRMDNNASHRDRHESRPP